MWFSPDSKKSGRLVPIPHSSTEPMELLVSNPKVELMDQCQVGMRFHHLPLCTSGHSVVATCLAQLVGPPSMRSSEREDLRQVGASSSCPPSSFGKGSGDALPGWFRLRLPASTFAKAIVLAYSSPDRIGDWTRDIDAGRMGLVVVARCSSLALRQLVK